MRRGIALIITVGALAMLILVGVSFALNMMLDLRFSRNFENVTKAKYLAEAGIKRAISELLYGPGGAIQSAADYPAEPWYSGYGDTSLLNSRGSYNVTIIDCNRQIYINDTNPNLSAILANLNAVLGSPLTAADISQLIANRPAIGYTTKEEIKRTFTGSASQIQNKYSAIKDYITIYAFVDPDVISPTHPYPAVPRAPINVNTASRQVLIAVLTGVSDGVNSISSTEAASLADYLIGGRPYTTHDQLRTRLVSAETAVIEDGDAAIVMANANPNTDLMSCNPNNSWRNKHISKSGSLSYPRAGVDGINKTKLTVYTTEFCFNSGGYYEVVSTGIVRQYPGGSSVASKTLQVAVKLFDQWRQTTQAQFEAGAKSNLTTYPEPIAAGITAANYDGQIMLATLRDSTPNSGTHFLVNYNGNSSLNADSGQAFTHLTGQINPNIASIIDTANRGNLYPDGLFAGEGTTYDAAYPASGAVDYTVGTVEMWVKPDWDAGSGSQYSVSAWNCPRFLAMTDTLHFYYSAIEFEYWRNSWNRYLATKTWAGITSQPADWHGVNGWYSWSGWYHYDIYSQQFNNDQLKAGDWRHVAFYWHYWDQGTPNPQGEQRLYCDGYAWNQSAHYPTGPQYPFNYIQVGGDAWSDVEAYSTIAGVRIFNSIRTQAQIQADSDRGMYYTAGGASFESSANIIGTARLCNVYWTEHIPAGVPGADIQFDLFDGSNWMGNYTTRSDPAGNSLNRLTGGAGAIKYKAYFIETGSGLRDTPLLDDVTITYTKGAHILYLRDV